MSGANILGLVDIGCQDWKDVTPRWLTDTGGYTMATTIFKGYIYVGTNKGQIFRSEYGSNWEDVTGNHPNSAIYDMAEFNGKLYADGWRLSDDTKTPYIWEDVISILVPKIP